jgi:hypothetical protein
MNKSTIASILHVLVGVALFLAPGIVLGAYRVGETHLLLDIIASTLSVSAAALSFAGLAANDAVEDFKDKKFQAEEQFVIAGAILGLAYGLIIYFAV